MSVRSRPRCHGAARTGPIGPGAHRTPPQLSGGSGTRECTKTPARRWPYPTNHKDIGTPHRLPAALAGAMGTRPPAPTRTEPAQPGNQTPGGHHQPHNVSTTAHAPSTTPLMVTPWAPPKHRTNPSPKLALPSGLGLWRVAIPPIMLEHTGRRACSRRSVSLVVDASVGRQLGPAAGCIRVGGPAFPPSSPCWRVRSIGPRPNGSEPLPARDCRRRARPESAARHSRVRAQEPTPPDPAVDESSLPGVGSGGRAWAPHTRCRPNPGIVG